MKYQKVNLKIKDYDDIYNHPLALKCNIDKIFVNYDTYNDIDITFSGKMILDNNNIYLQDEIKIYGSYSMDIYRDIYNNFKITCNFKSNLLNGEYLYIDTSSVEDEYNIFYITNYVDNLIITYEALFNDNEISIIKYNKKGKRIQSNNYTTVDDFLMFDYLSKTNKEERLIYVENIYNGNDDNYVLISFNKMEKVNYYYYFDDYNTLREDYHVRKGSNNNFNEYKKLNINEYIQNNNNLVLYDENINVETKLYDNNNDYDFDINDC